MKRELHKPQADDELSGCQTGGPCARAWASSGPIACRNQSRMPWGAGGALGAGSEVLGALALPSLEWPLNRYGGSAWFESELVMRKNNNTIRRSQISACHATSP